jgi:hypothetical protein
MGMAQFEDHAPQTFPFLKGLKKMTDQEMILWMTPCPSPPFLFLKKVVRKFLKMIPY